MQLVSETLLEWHAHRRKRMSESRRHTVKRARHNWNECLSFSISWVQLEEQACFLIYSRDMWTGKTVTSYPESCCHLIMCTVTFLWKNDISSVVYSDLHSSVLMQPMASSLRQEQLLHRSHQPSRLTCHVPRARDPVGKARPRDRGRKIYLGSRRESRRVMTNTILWTRNHICTSHKHDSVFHPA